MKRGEEKENAREGKRKKMQERGRERKCKRGEEKENAREGKRKKMQERKTKRWKEEEKELPDMDEFEAEGDEYTPDNKWLHPESFHHPLVEGVSYIQVGSPAEEGDVSSEHD